MLAKQSYKKYISYRDPGIFSYCIGGLLVLIVTAYGCSDTPPTVRKAPPAKTAQQAAAQPAAQPPLAELLADDTLMQKGYIYERKNRRDPFIPLILPIKPLLAKEKAKTGTLESYDFSEFTLAAIAKMGTQYYALLVTPDQRSFTVFKGTRLGLSKGKVQNISDKKVVLVEKSRDYKGTLKPREIILEFTKGEGEQ
jgi:Tfp pilus assembly protein PilP